MGKVEPCRYLHSSLMCTYITSYFLMQKPSLFLNAMFLLQNMSTYTYVHLLFMMSLPSIHLRTVWFYLHMVMNIISLQSCLGLMVRSISKFFITVIICSSFHLKLCLILFEFHNYLLNGQDFITYNLVFILKFAKRINDEYIYFVRKHSFRELSV